MSDVDAWPEASACKGGPMYLYGDCTDSKLDSNFLGVLPDALDYCVQTLLADEHIARRRAECLQFERQAKNEVACLRDVGSSLKAALARAPKGAEGGQASKCVATLQAASDLAVSAELASVQAGLDRCKAQLEESEQSERSACFKALENLLIRHDLPDTGWSLHLRTTDGALYTALLHGCTRFGLRWTLELDPTGEPSFERVVRVDKLVEHLQIHAPRLIGWLHKRPDVRVVRLDHHYLYELELTNESMKLFLSSGSKGKEGIHLHLLPEAPFGHARLDHASEGEPFVLEASDLDLLRELHERLLAVARTLTTRRKRLLGAMLDEVSLLEQPNPRIVAERLICVMAPITTAIAEHSAARGELVLKRVLDGNHREEVFVTRQELLSRLARLSPAHQSLFEPLGLREPRSALRDEHDEGSSCPTSGWVSDGMVASDGIAVVAMSEIDRSWGVAD